MTKKTPKTPEAVKLPNGSILEPGAAGWVLHFGGAKRSTSQEQAQALVSHFFPDHVLPVIAPENLTDLPTQVTLPDGGELIVGYTSWYVRDVLPNGETQITAISTEEANLYAHYAANEAEKVAQMNWRAACHDAKEQKKPAPTKPAKIKPQILAQPVGISLPTQVTLPDGSRLQWSPSCWYHLSKSASVPISHQDAEYKAGQPLAAPIEPRTFNEGFMAGFGLDEDKAELLNENRLQAGELMRLKQLPGQSGKLKSHPIANRKPYMAAVAFWLTEITNDNGNLIPDQKRPERYKKAMQPYKADYTHTILNLTDKDSEFATQAKAKAKEIYAKRAKP